MAFIVSRFLAGAIDLIPDLSIVLDAPGVRSEHKAVLPVAECVEDHLE